MQLKFHRRQIHANFKTNHLCSIDNCSQHESTQRFKSHWFWDTFFCCCWIRYEINSASKLHARIKYNLSAVMFVLFLHTINTCKPNQCRKSRIMHGRMIRRREEKELQLKKWSTAIMRHNEIIQNGLTVLHKNAAGVCAIRTHRHATKFTEI